MFRRRALIAAFVLASTFTMTTGTSQAAARIRIRVPWTQQTVFALAPDRSYVAEWNGPGAGWTIIGGPATAIYAGSAGVFELDDGGNILMYNGTPDSWTEIGGPGAEFVEGGGHLYGIGPSDDYVAEWNGTAGGGWTIIGGAAHQIAAGPAGLIEINPDVTETLIYDGTPGDWTQIGGASLGVYSGNGIYSVEPAGLEQWTGGTTWQTILNSDKSDFYVQDAGPAGLFIEDFNTDYEYNGTPYDWTQIGAFPLLIGAVSQTSVYGFTAGANSGEATDVEVYSGSGTTWTVIGGPAWQPWPGGGGLAAGG